MVTRIKIDRDYILQGVIVDKTYKRPLQGLRVEAWDRDTKYHDMLGQAVTDANGSFTIAFDADYFGDYAPDTAPDVFYKVNRDALELLNTFNQPQHNLARGTTPVRLEVDTPQTPPTGTDRITTEQAFKAVDWWQASDFRGTYTQTKDKTFTVGNLFGSLMSDALKNFDFAPVQPSDAREREIVGQQADSARTALLAQQVQVTDVQPVSMLGSSANAKLIAGYPLTLKANDNVTLYEDDHGIVKYYTVNKPPATTADGATVARIDGDVQSIKARIAGLDDLHAEIDNVKAANADVAARSADEATQTQAHAQEIATLQSQLQLVQQASASKDVQIAKLQSDLLQVTKAQDLLSSRLPIARINALEAQLNQLTRLAPARQTLTPKTARPAAKKASVAPAKAPAVKARTTKASTKAPAKKGKGS